MPTHHLFNDHWQFRHEQRDGEAWRDVPLPHDWSVEFPFDQALEGCTGYLPGGIGHYCKTLTRPTADRCYLNFDGIYNHAEVSLNGQRLAHQVYGYSPITLDLTDHLIDGENVIEVRVDRTRFADSRWYTGSGIYRDVTLIEAAAQHVAPGGVFVTTPQVSDGSATVHAAVQLRNTSTPIAGLLKVAVVDPTGNTVATSDTAVELADGDTHTDMTLDVPDPQLWDVDHPHLYHLRTTLVIDGTEVDHTDTTFGIRTFHFDADTGFHLNGRHLHLKGVCLHHDGGLVGAAVPDGVWERRLRKLIDAGVNAIRTAHNPPSAAFLDLCDKLGLLVQHEFFDEFNFPKDKRLNCQLRKEDHAT
ncbi:MAG: sugar-binding domain-containing protein, partial [Planctomycetota bacterium]